MNERRSKEQVVCAVGELLQGVDIVNHGQVEALIQHVYGYMYQWHGFAPSSNEMVQEMTEDVLDNLG